MYKFLKILLSLLPFAQLVHSNNDRWEMLKASGAENFIHGVWTGSEVLMALPSGIVTRFDPETNVLINSTGITPPELEQWFGYTRVWTGSELIIWGGYSGSISNSVNAGARYSPVTNTWRSLATTGAPGGRSNHSAVWTGSEMIVWGGQQNDINNPISSGGRYNPETDTWLPVNSVNAPQARQGHSAVWTGKEMIIWGGGGYHGPQGNYQTGGRYDPETDTWLPTSLVGAPSVRRYQATVWTGKEMIIWGGYNGGFQPVIREDFARYDPAADRWTPGNTEGAPIPRRWHSGIWTGKEMIVWGGRTLNPDTVLYSGGRYDPAADRWSPTSNESAPDARYGNTAYWTGKTMLVGGGSAFLGVHFCDIYSYTPETSPAADEFRITDAVMAGGKLIISFPGNIGRSYTLWQSETMEAGTWTNTGLPAIIGNGQSISFTFPAMIPGRRYFRVQAAP